MNIKEIARQLSLLKPAEQTKLQEELADNGVDVSYQRQEFIQKMVNTAYDPHQRKVTYSITAMYNVYEGADSTFADITEVQIDRFDMTMQEIDQAGGAGEVLDEIKAEYDIK